MQIFSSIVKVRIKNFTKLTNLISTAGMASSSKSPIAAVAQMRVTNDKKHNLAQVEEIIQKAKAQNAAFLFLPECCDFVGTNKAETLDLSEPLTGDLVKTYKQLAKENNLWLSLGGIHESILDKNNAKTNKIYNTHIVINDQGELTSKYQKLHMFDVDTPEFKFRESDVVERGKEVGVPISTPLGQLGLQICYDMRFPEASLILRKCGAELLTYPSAFAYSTGKAHWEILLRARAIENQCFVVAAAQIGFHNAKRQSWGHAMIVSPWGKILAECDPAKDVDVQVAEIDLSQVQTTRTNMPCFAHRRMDAYSLYPILSNEKSPTNVSEVYEFGNFVIPNDAVFYSTKHSFAFTNIRCVVPGHVLVASRRNIPRLHDLTDEEVTDFFQVVCLVQKVTEKIYNSTSSTVTVQDGTDAGQTVKHVHCHVMPRKPGDFEQNDEIYVELNKHDHDSTEKRRSPEEMAREAELFKKYF